MYQMITSKKGVVTAQGFIPHMRVSIDGMTVDAPVRVYVAIEDTQGWPLAETDARNSFIYALPGGYVLLPSGRIMKDDL